MDVLANPIEEVLVYDIESWRVWKEVWDTFERDGVPRTDDLNTMQRSDCLPCMSKFVAVAIAV